MSDASEIMDSIVQKNEHKKKKRIIISCICVFIAILLISCAAFLRFRGLAYSAKVVIDSPNKYSSLQIEKAAEKAKSYFENNFSGCFLNTLTYNKLLSEKGNNTNAEKIIVFDAKYSVYWATETNVVGNDNITQISVKYNNNTFCDVSAGLG